jgi:type IX secretion system PorP/SprF family membrane protein
MKKFALVLSMFLSFFVYAQDMIYDMSYGNRLTMNPAFCGNDGQGKIRATIFHHNQYLNNRGPFHYSSAAIDYGVCRSPITFGLVIQNETQGDGLLRTNAISPIIGAIFNGGSNTTFSFGLQANFINYTVDWSKYVFSDQLDPINGYTGQPSSNANAGVINDFATGVSGGANLTRWFSGGAFNLGFALNHVIAPRFSLLDYTRTLPLRYTFHSAMLFKKGQYKINNAVEIAARYDHQGMFNTILVSGGWYANQYCFLGTGGRLGINPEGIRNSIKPIVELRIMPKENTKILFSYGFNIARNSSGLGNAFEIGIIYVPSVANCNPVNIITSIWNKNKKSSRTGRQRITCPTFQNSKIGTPTF